MTPEEMMADYDWRNVFQYVRTESANIESALPVGDYNLTQFGLEDVKEIFDQDPGQKEGPSWICYGKLKDGRFFYLEAGCYYTGWFCIDDVSVTISDSKDECERFGMTDDARRRMNITLEEK